MFENIGSFFKKMMKNDQKELLAESSVSSSSKDAAKERLHVVLMQDRANVSADFLELMKEEIVEVIKKYIVVDESKIDVRLTNEENEDGSVGAPLLHANIPIINIRNDIKCEILRDNDNPSNNTDTEINEDKDRTQVIQIINDNSLINEEKEETEIIKSEEMESSGSIEENEQDLNLDKPLWK